jgi:hypothetical protein
VRTMYMRMAVLNLILKATGIQCNCMSAGVTRSRGRRPKASRAAAFWTRGSRAIVEAGMQAEPRYSSRDGRV